MLCLSEPLNKVVVATSGYTEELAHNRHGVFTAVTIDNRIFYFGPHFLPVNCRKSRSRLFSISSRAISFWTLLLLPTDVYGDDHFTVTLDVVVSPPLWGWLFGLGDGVEVLSPDWAAADFRRRLEETLKLYQK